ncbi:hypothetical protein JNUCC76_08740 [Leuconostoc sp. JNUCC 76]
MIKIDAERKMMLTLKQVRTVQFFMNNLKDYCEHNKIEFPFKKLVFMHNDELITANWIDDDFDVDGNSVINIRTNYLSTYSDELFSRDRLIQLLNDRNKLMNLIYQITNEFQELPNYYWVSDVHFMKSDISLDNFLFSPEDRFTLVSF